MKKPNIILFDVETAPMEVRTFSLFNKQPIHHTNIITDWFMISAAWKRLGEDKVYSASIKEAGNDYEVVKKLREVLNDADIVIGHNSDKFDIKKLNARIIYHSLPPLSPCTSVDTLKEVRKIAAFSSNRLDYLGKHLVGHGKIETSSGLWERAMNGNRKAIKEMVEYNKIDVVRLEELYVKLLPYIKTHPHLGVLGGEERHSCPKCSSLKIVRHKVRVTAGGTQRQQLQCEKCGSYHTVPITYGF